MKRRKRTFRMTGAAARAFVAEAAVEIKGEDALCGVAPDSPLGASIKAAKAIADAADLRERAFALYKGPFRYEQGYIWDANNEMVADDRKEVAVSRVRGWGRMKYLPDTNALQDAVGTLIAEALTDYWRRHG